MAAESIIRGLLNKGKAVRNIEEPWWSRRYGDVLSGIAEIPQVLQKAKMYRKNNLNDQAASLEKLAKLVTDKNSLDNFVKVSKNISEEMRDFPGLVPQANVIEQFTANMSSNYDSYSTEMERGAKIIDAPNFLDTQAEFLDLGKSIKGLALEDGKTPEYEGTLDYLVKENDKLNSIIGRIDSASKATQFRYNKNSKYTDQEIKEKLMSHQKRLGVAVQTAIGNGEITPEEAEFIMLGDVETYKESKKNKVNLLKSQYKRIDQSQKTLSTQLQRLQLKGIKDSDAPDLARLFMTELNAQGSEEVMDTGLDGLTIDQMIKDIEDKNKNLNIAKDRVMSSYNAWEGRPMFDAPKATNSEIGNLLDNIMIDDGKDINNPTKNKSIQDITIQKDEKTTKLTYDPAMGDTIPARNKARVNKYKISPQQLGELEEDWTETNTGETFDQFLDVIFGISDRSLKDIWENMSSDEKSKYRTLSNFKKAVKTKPKE